MNDSRAICPQCRKEVVFVQMGETVRCPQCGFSYQLSPPRIEVYASRSSAPPWRAVLRALVIALVVAIALAVVGVAVLYAGCAYLMRNV